jgi:hypothetical protein
MAFSQAAGLSIDPAVTTQAGWCLGFVQSVLGAPVNYRSATLAANAVTDMHTDRDIPSGVAVPVWFDHWGTYGIPPEYGNWGHVVVHMTDGRFLSSPLNGRGQQWFNSITEIEAAFNAKFRGWSTDINGLQVASTKLSRKATRTMFAIRDEQGTQYLVTDSQVITIGDTYNFEILKRVLASDPASPTTFSVDDISRIVQYVKVTPVDVSAVVPAISAAVSNINVNTDALASAIAKKLGKPESEPITKAAIQAAIEANYKESK